MKGCGWCPMLLPDDPDEWRHHFVVAHGYGGGYSIRYDVVGSDWDIAELDLRVAQQETP